MSGIVAFEGELNSIVKEVCINNALFIIIVTLRSRGHYCRILYSYHLKFIFYMSRWKYGSAKSWKQ